MRRPPEGLAIVAHRVAEATSTTRIPMGSWTRGPHAVRQGEASQLLRAVLAFHTAIEPYWPTALSKLATWYAPETAFASLPAITTTTVLSVRSVTQNLSPRLPDHAQLG